MSRNLVGILIILCVANGLVWGSVAMGDASDESSFYFLDVGQGDGEIIRSGGAVYMIDGGKNNLAAEALAGILPFLRRRIDVLFVSHPQQDHIGGLFDVIKRYDVGVVLWNGERNELWDSFSTALSVRGIPVFAVALGDVVRRGGDGFRVAWPPVGIASADENDRSLVLFFSNGTTTVLYAGDVTEKVERVLTASAPSSIDLLKVAHHGSKYSSSQIFLDVLRPLVAVVEVGKNSYGHPTQEVLARLAAVGAQIFRTDQNGTMCVTKNVAGIQVRGMR